MMWSSDSDEQKGGRENRIISFETQTYTHGYYLFHFQMSTTKKFFIFCSMIFYVGSLLVTILQCSTFYVDVWWIVVLAVVAVEHCYFFPSLLLYLRMHLLIQLPFPLWSLSLPLQLEYRTMMLGL